jgi:hypothetical protein
MSGTNRVFAGERVRLRDGRIVDVTQAPGPGDTLEWVDQGHYEQTGRFIINDVMPNETILIGTNIENGKTVITDMCEVKMVIDKAALV